MAYHYMMINKIYSQLFAVPRVCLMLIVIVCSGCGQVEFTLSNGQQVSLDSFKGRWVVVNYWATWCKPCIEEIPELNKLNQRDGIVVLGVNYDGLTGNALASEAKNLGINYDLIIDNPSEKIKVKRPGALPATVIIDNSGLTRDVLFGPQTVLSITEKIKLLAKK